MNPSLLSLCLGKSSTVTRVLFLLEKQKIPHDIIRFGQLEVILAKFVFANSSLG